MKVSGFTMVKNAGKLYYPVVESIKSILPIVDEFIVALGDCDSDDDTRKLIEAIGDNKIKIIDTVWDVKTHPRNMVLAHQTDIAMSHCTGDWLFYLQSDEVVHEDDLEKLHNLMQANLNRTEVDGILFDYIHLWGDYEHQRIEHGWYKHEIRIVKPIKDLHSWRDAQSFRIIPSFDGLNYYRKENTFKLKVIKSDCKIYHYGWVRPPKLMIKKLDVWFQNIAGNNEVEKLKIDAIKTIYHNMNDYKHFTEAHPQVMQNRISLFNWHNDLDFNGEYPEKVKLKKKVVNYLEEKIFKRPLFEFKNYIVLNK